MEERATFDPGRLGGAPERVPRAELAGAMAALEAERPPFWALHEEDAIVGSCLDRAAATPDWAEEVVVLGASGGIRGARAVVGALGAGARRRLRFVETVDPDAVARLFYALDLGHTLFFVVAPAGEAPEIRALVALVWERLGGELGTERARQRLVLALDPDAAALRAFADERRLAWVPLPRGLPGRFLTLSSAGLLPAAWAGVDVLGLCVGARAMAARCARSAEPGDNPALAAAAGTFALGREGRPLLLFWPLAEALAGTAALAAELFAEATCAGGGGIAAFAAPAAAAVGPEVTLLCDGPPLGQVRFLEIARSEADPAVAAALPAQGRAALSTTLATTLAFDRLGRAGVPSARLTLPTLHAHTLGELLFFLEVEAALCGRLFGRALYSPAGKPL